MDCAEVASEYIEDCVAVGVHDSVERMIAPPHEQREKGLLLENPTMQPVEHCRGWYSIPMVDTNSDLAALTE